MVISRKWINHFYNQIRVLLAHLYARMQIVEVPGV